jgi:hypothetical protein
MLEQTRRRVLGLLIAAGFGAGLLPTVPRAVAQDDEENGAETREEESPSEQECFDTKAFGEWTGQASDTKAGASQNEVPLLNTKACTLTMQLQVNTEFEARIFVQGDEENMPLPEDYLVTADNRLIAKTAEGRAVVDEPLCGNCTDIYDNGVSIVLPLAVAPLFRDQDAVEFALKLVGRTEDCRFKVDCITMRKALVWAAERRNALAAERDNDTCTSAEGCFITTACCEILGLGDDCFELRTLRRYRDRVLARRPGGAAAIARYYELAPRILARLSTSVCNQEKVLLSAYARYVLPAAIAAKLGLDALAYRLYVRMLNQLTGWNAVARANLSRS